MAFKVNDSNKSVGTEFSRYIGKCPMKVIAINPTIAEGEVLGIKISNDTYTSEKEGVKTVRIDFHLLNEEHNIKTKHSIFLEDKNRVASTGNLQWINNHIQHSWAGSSEELLSKVNANTVWFSENGLRQAKVGEVELYSFVTAWLNLNTKDEVVFDDFNKFFTGDVNELKNYVKPSFETQIIVVYLDIKTSEKTDETTGAVSPVYYQTVYNKFFGRLGTKDATWMKEINGSEPKEWNGSLELREFTPNKVEATNLAITANDDTLPF